ncbi:MAG: hypothetical protein OXD40_09455 [bacterium]|nr:hypothetical protein [bacterium]
MVEMRIPGDRCFIPRFIVEDTHPDVRLLYPQEWQAYQDGTDQLAGHTRLEDVPWLDPAMKDNLRLRGVLSLEQMATITDNNVLIIGKEVGPQLLQWRDRAREEVDAKHKSAAFDGQQKQIDDLKAELASIKKSRPRSRA